MKRIMIKCLLFATAVISTSAVRGAQFYIASCGRASASIVVNSDAPATKFAASELARYVKAMSGADIQVVVGRKTGGARVELDDRLKGAASEEFFIEVKGSALTLSGGSPRAVLYAVYELLEHLGCGFWSPINESVPSRRDLYVDSAWKVSAKPAFAWRQVHSQYGYNMKWKPKMRINGRMWTSATPENLGGWEAMDMGQSLGGLNAGEAGKRLFAEHPDWFAWREKEKKRVRQQMCTSNDEVVTAVVARIRSKYKTNPAKTGYVSVSMRDNDKTCQCEKCSKFSKRHGGASALIADCANRVGRAIANDLPNVRVVFLAYWITGNPPKDMVLEPNVTVCWAMLRNFAVPPSKVPGHDTALNRWRALAHDNVVIWDYNAQFKGFLLPTPIIDMMGPGLREYEAKNVKGVLMQMAGFGAPLMDFAELRSWLCAKLMWNPRQDEWALMQQWCDGACGAGASAVKEWLELRRAARERKRRYGPYDPDSLHVFTPKELVLGYELMLKALGATEGDPRTHAQVRRLSLSPITALICNYNRGISAAAKADKVAIPERERLIDEFEAICAEYKVTSFGEGMPSVPEFIKLMRGGGELLKGK